MWTRDATISAFQAFINDPDFPCVGAKSALATHGMAPIVAGDLRDADDDLEILAALRRMPAGPDPAQGLISTVVLFPMTPVLSEAAFEKHLWNRLQALHDYDSLDCGWDGRVSGDPQSPDFGFSIGGAAYFVVGLHPGASRLSRRAPMATLAFNPHAQFRRLKDIGKYGRLQHVVRERDVVLQGTNNPMLSEHGVKSEASQYSGRTVSSSWSCPFHNHGKRHDA